jgi:hypothetical protein
MSIELKTQKLDNGLDLIEVWLMIRFQKFTNILIILVKIIQILIAAIGILSQKYSLIIYMIILGIFEANGIFIETGILKFRINFCELCTNCNHN